MSAMVANYDGGSGVMPRELAGVPRDVKESARDIARSLAGTDAYPRSGYSHLHRLNNINRT